MLHTTAPRIVATLLGLLIGLAGCESKPHQFDTDAITMRTPFDVSLVQLDFADNAEPARVVVTMGADVQVEDIEVFNDPKTGQFKFEASLVYVGRSDNILAVADMYEAQAQQLDRVVTMVQELTAIMRVLAPGMFGIPPTPAPIDIMPTDEDENPNP